MTRVGLFATDNTQPCARNIFLLHMFFEKVIQHHFKFRSPDFLQIVIHPGIGFVNFDDAVLIDGPADDRRVTFGSVNGDFKIV